MKVVEIAADSAVGEVGGIRRKINLVLVDGVEVGDYVIVHAGFAIEKLDEDDAMETLRLLSELAEAAEVEDRRSRGKDEG
jgi:hydrogenase expression/formation protein HypC